MENAMLGAFIEGCISAQPHPRTGDKSMEILRDRFFLCPP